MDENAKGIRGHSLKLVK